MSRKNSPTELDDTDLEAAQGAGRFIDHDLDLNEGNARRREDAASAAETKPPKRQQMYDMLRQIIDKY